MTRKDVDWGLLVTVCVARSAARYKLLSQYLQMPKLKHSHGNAPAVLISPSLLLFPVAQKDAKGQILPSYTSTILESLWWLQLVYTQVNAKQRRTDSCLTLQQWNKSLRVCCWLLLYCYLNNTWSYGSHADAQISQCRGLSFKAGSWSRTYAEVIIIFSLLWDMQRKIDIARTALITESKSPMGYLWGQIYQSYTGLGWLRVWPYA